MILNNNIVITKSISAEKVRLAANFSSKGYGVEVIQDPNDPRQFNVSFKLPVESPILDMIWGVSFIETRIGVLNHGID